ncbi:MAG: TolC family protein [Candidatus Omnitrophica bacterium]|nr:TolC family protein [Candidatus Omnitrophota bacterium]
MKFLTWLILVQVFFIAPLYAEESKEVNLNPLIEEALANNPEVQAAYNRWKAAEYKITEVSSLPDPMASFSGLGDPVETRLGPIDNKYSVSQMFPFPGKLGLEAKSKGKSAEMLKEKYEAVKREVIKNVKFLYYDMLWVNRAIQVTEEEKLIQENMEKVAQRKYESNVTSQQDVIKAQVELSKLIERLFQLKQNRNSIEAMMNSVLNRPQGTLLGRTASVELTDFKYELSRLRDMARESRQELLAAGLDIKRAEYEKSLAKLDYFPDFTLGVDYTEIGTGSITQIDDGKDAWMAMVSINLPIWFNRLGAQFKGKKAMLEAAKKDYEVEKNSVEYEVDDLYFKINTYKEIVSLYKTALVPQAKQAFEATRTGYETGKVDFLNWLDSERMLLQTRLAYYKAIVDYQKSIAYLERVVGRDL